MCHCRDCQHVSVSLTVGISVLLMMFHALHPVRDGEVDMINEVGTIV